MQALLALQNIFFSVGENQDLSYGNDLGGNGNSMFPRDFFGWDHGNDIFTGTGMKSHIP